MFIFQALLGWVTSRVPTKQDAEESDAPGRWTGLISYLRQGLEFGADLPVYVKVKAPFWRSSGYRTNRLIPVDHLNVDRDTWEACIHLPGLFKGNAIGNTAMTFKIFIKELEDIAESADHCTPVISDEYLLTKAQLAELCNHHKNEWEGAPMEDLKEYEDFTARLDLPLRKVAMSSYDEKLVLIIRT